MSAEFITEYEENRIAVAIENMERTKRGLNSILEYILEIQDTYSAFPQGTEEVYQLIRTAEFIINIGEDYDEAEMEAFYFGELFGLELVNHITADTGAPYKMGYAKSFLDAQLSESREKIEKGTMQVEDGYDLARKIQLDLFSNLDVRNLHPKLEVFGGAAAEEFTSSMPDSPQKMAQKYAFIMGFRLILMEALRLPERPSHESLADIYIPSVEELEGIFETKWEDISSIPKRLAKKYIEFFTSGRTYDVSDPHALENGVVHAGEKLKEFNESTQLLKEGEFLSIEGDLFALSNNSNHRSTLNLFSPGTEIRGVFSEVRVINAPPSKQINQANHFPFEWLMEEAKHREIAVPAIRLNDPILIYKDAEGKETVERQHEVSIDIPLTYKDVVFKRMVTDGLEKQA